MTKLSKKSLLLFISAIAMAAFAMPSMASAVTFHGPGNHTLTSSNLSVTSAALGAGWSCTSSVLEVNVAANTASASVTNATFTGCSGLDGLATVPATVTATNFPWTITRTAVGTIVIDGIHAVAHFPAATLSLTVSGNLAGGAVNNTTHTVTYAGGLGLTMTLVPAHGGIDSSASAAVTGDLRDDQNSLGVT